MSLDSQTFDYRKGLLQLSGLLSDSDSKKIVFLLGLPKALEEKAPWEVLAHLEAQGKATVEEFTKILKAIDRQDAAKKAKELIGKNSRKKTTDSGSKGLILRDSLQLATKHCKILVEQVDYLKVAANKDGNKRIEQIASEAKEKLVIQVEKQLRYALALFNSQIEVSYSPNDSPESSSPTSSREGSPVSSPPSIVRSRITASELKGAAEKLKQRKGNSLHPNPHATWRRITGDQLKKAAGKLTPTHKESPLQPAHQAQTGTGTIVPTARPAARSLHRTKKGEGEGEDDEGHYSSISEVMPLYENLPHRGLHPPIPCSESRGRLEISSRNSATIHPGINLHTTEVTSDVSSVEDNSCSTFSGDDSGFSDSRAYLKEPPLSSSEHAHKQREQGSDAINNCSSAAYASLNTRTGYYKSLNPETRTPDVIYEQANKCN